MTVPPAPASSAPAAGDQAAEAAARVRALREFAGDTRTVPVLTQTEPDPDAIGSALAVRFLLDRTDRNAPMVSLGTSRRPETRRMLELLDIQVTEVTEAELKGFERIIAVDMQPTGLTDGTARFAVIDHHPAEKGYEADFLDIRTEFGAAATMLTGYLRADGREPNQRLATALLYGIRTDTALLTRGCTRDDVEAYAWLQERADLAVLSKIDRPAYPQDALGQIGRALERAEIRDDVAVLWLGRVRKSRAHLMPELADLSLNIAGVSWVAAGGVIERALVLNIRYISETEPGAGALARLAAKDTGGFGGGHATMARVEIPLSKLPIELEDEPQGDAAKEPSLANLARLADWIMAQLERLKEEAKEEPQEGRPPRSKASAGT